MTERTRHPGRLATSVGRRIALLAAVLATVWQGARAAEPGSGSAPAGDRDRPDGIHVVDGSYVMNVGNLHMNITNHGLIGSRYTQPTTYSEAPSGQWPGGSGVEYLWAAGLWVGGVLGSDRLVSTGQYAREFRPRFGPENTIYEARGGRVTRPFASERARGRRISEYAADDDRDGVADEEVLDGADNDGDGEVDEDFGQIGDQMMVCTMYDNLPLASEEYPDHVPLNLKVVQTCYASAENGVDGAVMFDYQITNIGLERITDVYIGFFVDSDVSLRSGGGGGDDDLLDYYDGVVMANSGLYSRVSVFYTYDGAPVDPVPGYMGFLFMDHTTDPTSWWAPNGPKVRGFQAFAGEAPFQQGGLPNDDSERYDLLSRQRWDPPAAAGQENDWRYLVSVGPFPRLPPGRSVRFSFALVAGGATKDEFLRTCADVMERWYGRTFDVDGDAQSAWYSGGYGGRETKICREDLDPRPEIPFELVWRIIPSLGDRSCTGEDVGLLFPLDEQDFFREGGKWCAYVNMDNCTECSRLAGEVCTVDNQLWRRYGCGRADANGICTGFNSQETQVRWTNARVPPTPPNFRLQPGQNLVHLYWDDSSEYASDPYTGQRDFESYRLWRADKWDRPPGSSEATGPSAELWRMIAEYDLVDHYVEYLPDGTTTRADTLTLGRNTGLEGVRYRPRCLDDAAFAGLAEAMQQVVDSDSLGLWATCPPVRDHFGVVMPKMTPLLPWESHEAVLDTFFMVAERTADPQHGIAGKRGQRFYEYVDRDVHNGFIYFYSVAATDKYLERRGGQWVCLGPGQVGDPQLSFATVSPGTPARGPEAGSAQRYEVFVYPNPATRASLDEFQRLHPNAGDPTGTRIMFANLPRSRNLIRIYTLDGDLVQEIWHDGRDGHGEASWNMVSRNGQQVASGIYMFAVDPEDAAFGTSVGKFVIIR